MRSLCGRQFQRGSEQQPGRQNCCIFSFMVCAGGFLCKRMFLSVKNRLLEKIMISCIVLTWIIFCHSYFLVPGMVLRTNCKKRFHTMHVTLQIKEQHKVAKVYSMTKWAPSQKTVKEWGQLSAEPICICHHTRLSSSFSSSNTVKQDKSWRKWNQSCVALLWKLHIWWLL